MTGDLCPDFTMEAATAPDFGSYFDSQSLLFLFASLEGGEDSEGEEGR